MVEDFLAGMNGADMDCKGKEQEWEWKVAPPKMLPGSRRSAVEDNLVE